MTLDRLRHMLDAYGASPDRWPPEEKEAGLALLETSQEAQAERDKAARLDATLDQAPAQQPSPELAARVLAAAQVGHLKAARRPARVRRAGSPAGKPAGARRTPLWRYLAAAAPVAAAATLVLWLTRLPDLPPAESMQLTIAELGEYETPMDVLLEPPSFDLIGTVPSLGCTDSGLGCPDLDFPRGIESRSHLVRRTRV